ncbi:hypothetical protein QQP08_011711 [Theobroma cacao]|uniref:Uncharacterized protein n=1 Tax=Theobroma cacao TaxID=3641 RepID=A0A061G488_THECC|nr:Uncharacterized protein TCM_016196 [Theobroma cacao]WRX19224.1 hypothetical protein QQP08_011711 [Theobroma cacao]
MANNYPQFVAEITFLSAENLKKPSFALLSRRLRPIISISISKFNGNNPRADYKGDVLTLDDKFLVPIEANFFANRCSRIHLQLHTTWLLGRQAQLGWCWIGADDIGAPPVGSVRYLSYRLRSKDGTKGNGIVNLKLKLDSYGCPANSRQEVSPRSNYAHRINWPEES